MPGFSFRPTVTVADPSQQLQWSGTLISERRFLGRHSFILSANPDGTTHLTNHEEFSGGLTTPFQRFMKQTNDNGYTAFNAGLKRHVETAPRSRTAPEKVALASLSRGTWRGTRR